MDKQTFRNFFLGFIKIHILYHASKEPIYGQEFSDELHRHGYEISFGTLYPIFLVIISIVAISIVLVVFRIRKQKQEQVTLEPGRDRNYLAIARALARIEELRAAEKLDEETYRRLKKEYESKLEKAKKES